jgi:hypothetical protein
MRIYIVNVSSETVEVADARFTVNAETDWDAQVKGLRLVDAWALANGSESVRVRIRFGQRPIVDYVHHLTSDNA